MRLLFVSLPLVGHTDWGGMLATAGELASRPGLTVAWASGRQLAPVIEAAAVPFAELAHTGWIDHPPLPDNLPAAGRAAARRSRALDAWLDADAVLAAADELEQVIAGWQPDLVAAEPYAAAAALAAERRGLPLVVCGRPALVPDARPAANPAGQRIDALCRTLGIAGRCWDLDAGQMRSPRLHLDFFTRRWYADLPDLGQQTRFCGARTANHPLDGPRAPTVLITLGSLFIDDPAFFRIAAEAVLAEGGHPLVVTGRRGAAAGDVELELPDEVETAGWVDFDATLPRLAGVIHHGGVGTTHAALRHGTPQVAVPHAGDQHIQAGRITRAGAGYGVRPADFTPANARWLARQLLTNDDLRASARAWQAELVEQGGPAAAADALWAVLGEG